MTVRLLPVNGVELGVEEFGSATDPAILLIAGAAGSMDWWDSEFCARLAAGERRVVRYDFRDTGISTSYPPGVAGYTSDDLVDDAVGIVTELGLAPVHLVGISLGGMLAQQIAVRRPDLVGALTLCSTSPDGPGDADNGLPPMDPVFAAGFSDPAPDPDWSDPVSVGDFFVSGERHFAGSIPLDEERIRTISADVARRSASPESAANHWSVTGRGEPRERLSEIRVPTLVVHGSADPFFPIGHGEALAREIPGAELLAVAGMGHQYPPTETWPEVIPAILALRPGGGQGIPAEGS